MSDEKKNTSFDLREFMTVNENGFARPTLFQLSINGYERQTQLMVNSIEMHNDLMEVFTVYENEEGEMTAMLLDLQSQCNPEGSWYRAKYPDRFESDGAPPARNKPGVLCTMTRFRKDGSAYITRHYRLDEITFHTKFDWDETKFDWDETNKILHHVVYVGHCEKI